MDQHDPRLRNGRVTVVIPTYNRADLVPRAIESALAQTARGRCDIVVVDDGSQDHTPQVVRRYADITCIRQQNTGLAGARNKALRTVINEFAAFLDDDDEWEPDKIARQLALFDRWPSAVLVAGPAFWVQPDGTTRIEHRHDLPLGQLIDAAPTLFESNIFSVADVLVRTSALQQIGLFEQKFRSVEDYHAWVRLACRGRFVLDDAPVARIYLDTPERLTDKRLAMLHWKLAVHCRLRQELHRRPDCRRAWRTGTVRCLGALRDRCFLEGRYASAIRYGLWSLFLSPRNRPRWEWYRPIDALGRLLLPFGRRRPDPLSS